MLALRGVTEAGQDILVREIWELAQQIGFAHTCCEVRENIVNRHPHATDARLTAALPGLDGDDAVVPHVTILRPACSPELPMHAGVETDLDAALDSPIDET
jgi:hypothetical protein